MDPKKTIIGVAKKAGKFILNKSKSFGGYALRHGVNALISNEILQKTISTIAVTSGIIAASQLVPAVGGVAAFLLAGKFVYDKLLTGNKNRKYYEDISATMGDIINFMNIPLNSICDAASRRLVGEPENKKTPDKERED